MTNTNVAEQTPQLREYFRKWLIEFEGPLAAYDQEIAGDDALNVDDRVSLSEQVLGVTRQIETALDLEAVSPELRHELFVHVLRPDSPEALDEADNKIVDRLIGHAVRARNLDDVVYYARVMSQGRHSGNDVRLKLLTEILQAIQDQAEALEPAETQVA